MNIQFLGWSAMLNSNKFYAWYRETHSIHTSITLLSLSIDPLSVIRRITAFVILKAPFVVNILHVNTEPPPRKFKRFRDWRWSDQWLIKAHVKKGLRQRMEECQLSWFPARKKVNNLKFVPWKWCGYWRIITVDYKSVRLKRNRPW